MKIKWTPNMPQRIVLVLSTVVIFATAMFWFAMEPTVNKLGYGYRSGDYERMEIYFPYNQILAGEVLAAVSLLLALSPRQDDE